MPRMSDFDRDDYGKLLADDCVDASNGILFPPENGILPADDGLTIYIGLGGAGIKTIDQVKGMLSKSFNGSWRSCVAFVGIDSDHLELRNTCHLNMPDYLICTTLSDEWVGLHHAAKPMAWKRIIGPNNRILDFIPCGDGTCGRRLGGKLRLYNKKTGVMGNDEQIVAALRSIQEKMRPSGDKCRVYVIGGAGGETGGGMFTEMPTLIRKALRQCQTVQIYGFLYLPDILERFFNMDEGRFYSNGYATLKELDYYQGIRMRDGYNDLFPSNDPTTGGTVPNGEGAYDIPFLIGSAYDNVPGGEEGAVAEFLLKLLEKPENPWDLSLVDSILNNAIVGASNRGQGQNPFAPIVEPPGEHHEFSKCYGAMGFASAGVPTEMMRARAVGKLCKAAGIRTEVPAVRCAFGGDEALRPFRDEADYLSATEGTAKAVEILQPLAMILPMIHDNVFNMRRALNMPEITWDMIRRNEYDTPYHRAFVENFINKESDMTAMRSIEQAVMGAAAAVRQNIKAYVEAEGPLAYGNLYRGAFLRDSTGFGKGLEAMLQDLSEGKNMLTGEPYYWIPPEEADCTLAAERHQINSMPTGVIFTVVHQNERRVIADRWVRVFESAVDARIIKRRRDYFLGYAGKLAEILLRPNACLAEEIRVFGHMLNTLSDIYTRHGMATVNDPAMGNVQITGADPLRFRRELIDHFFGTDEDGRTNRTAWMYVPAERVKFYGGGACLTNDKSPVPGRQIFDEIVARELAGVPIPSLDVYFRNLIAQGADVSSVVTEMLRDLGRHSQVLLRGNLPMNGEALYITYPAVLDTIPVGESGETVGSTLCNRASYVFQMVSVQSRQDADRITLCRVVVPFEIYVLSGLREWESYYEASLNDPFRGCCLHGYSPFVEESQEEGIAVYKDPMPWKDFPSITQYNDSITEQDPITGTFSREGIARLELRKLIQEAKELGVLYAEADHQGRYNIMRVYCDRCEPYWRFDASEAEPDETGCVPIGRGLAQAVADQNHRDLASMTKKVALYGGGIFGEAASTEESAWIHAEKVLRKHVPMYLEVKETVEKFRTFAELICCHNKRMMERFYPAKMIKLMQAQVLYLDKDSVWKLQDETTEEPMRILPLADMHLRMMRMISGKDYAMVTQGLKGYYLYTKLMEYYAHSKTTIDDSFKLAQKRLQAMSDAGDMDETQRNVACTDFIMEERKALEEKGVRLSLVEEGAPAEDDFLESMAALGITDPETIQSIREFYNRIMYTKMI